MPPQYDAIKQSYLDKGTPAPKAKEIAARTYIKRGKLGTPLMRAKSLQTDRKAGR